MYFFYFEDFCTVYLFNIVTFFDKIKLSETNFNLQKASIVS